MSKKKNKEYQAPKEPWTAEEKIQKEKLLEEEFARIKQEIDDNDPLDLYEEDYEESLDQAEQDIRRRLTNGKVTLTHYVYPGAYRGNYDWRREDCTEEFTPENTESFCEDFKEQLMDPDNCMYTLETPRFDTLQQQFQQKITENTDSLWDPYFKERLSFRMDEYFWQLRDEFLDDHYFDDELSERISVEMIKTCLSQNPRYANKFEKFRKEEEQKKIIGQTLLTIIPENFIDLFPSAREMHRKFVLHIGPTNSGKTHDALAELMSAENGVYLAPLRLLAYECYEKLNAAGVPCRMLTGEEELDVTGAKHVASTIEMADLSRHYTVAVIDEAQMIGDEFRGGAWTAAILGLQADVIHICMAEYARDIVVSLIESCGDTYETVEHYRDTPLEPDYNQFSFPQTVQKGDAMIVFSRRDVFHCAAEAQDAGLKCSVVYGALPYDTRRYEVDRFLSGETDVIIATDAIGMGMNLPIKRIVFLKAQKYDRKRERDLKPEEIQQIAGRAGRKGLYEKGTYTAEFGAKRIRKLLEKKVPPITAAVIRFPKAIIGIEGKLSSIIEQWMALPEKPGYRKADSTRELELAKELEKVNEDKGLIFRFVSLTFDESPAHTFSFR